MLNSRIFSIFLAFSLSIFRDKNDFESLETLAFTGMI